MLDKEVGLSEVEPGIVQLTMQDRANKNTFSKELIIGLIDAFKTIASYDHCKVVILTGYDNYFASGGTQEGLLAIYKNETTFSEVNFYSLALDCNVPVISAMQGHGIGGGFVMGLFADFVILSRESVYTTNFMRYGFTPGMGATYILEKKLGIVLAEEMLMTADNYRGADLEKRGIPFPVCPRADVMEKAMDLARKLAEKPKASLSILKRHLTRSIQSQLPGFIEQELAMHERTFHEPEVKDRILSLFGKK